MSLPARLPVGLESWGEALNVLTPALASGLMPLLHGLDDLVHRRDAGSGSTGPLDGYDGLASRGSPERILMSEWLFADEIPLEFLRRAAQNELLYLAPAYQRPQPRGRVVVLVDSGPDQLGAPRLVQLAALIVLQRRSAARGVDIVVGILGEDALTWLDGDLGRLLSAWRLSRRRVQPTLVDLDLRQDQLEPADEVWILAGRRICRALADRALARTSADRHSTSTSADQRRVLQINEGTWGPEGVGELHVALDGDVIELALPSRELSVRALRGSGFRPADKLSTAPHLSGMRDPSFNSQSRQLIVRGDGNTEIVTVAISDGHATKAARIRRHRFPGPVLAAAFLGRRLVALTLEDDELRVRVVGKPMGDLDHVSPHVSTVGCTAQEIQEGAAADGLAPLYFRSDGLICQIRGTWWRLSPDHCLEVNALAVAPGRNVDVPRMAIPLARGLWIDRGLLPDSANVTAAVLGHGGWCAISDEGTSWRPYRGGAAAPAIAITDGAEILALVDDGGEPKIVTLSSAGLIVRLVGANGSRTLTAWSGGAVRPTIHPWLPLIAVQRAHDVIKIGDLFSGDVLQVVRSEE